MSRSEQARILRERKQKRKKLVKTVILVIVLAVLLSMITATGYAIHVIHRDAEVIDASNIYANVAQKSTLYDLDGKEIDTLYFSGGNRTLLKYKEIPEDMKNAVIAIEDKTFYDHHGFNFIRMVGAIKEKIVSGGQVSGTSTITQQLARNVFLSDTMSEHSIDRKIVEAWYTLQLERDLTKEQILEAYLNTVYFGFDSYGLEAAANNYFSKSAKELSTEECVALAALPQSPDTFALVKYDESGELVYNGDASQSRRNLTASLMKENGTLDAQAYEAVVTDNLKERLNIRKKKENTAAYYTDYAIEQVVEDLSEEYGKTKDEARQMVYTKGLCIYTCLDNSVQKILTEEINRSSNYTGIAYYRTDSDENIIDAEGDVMARPYSSYIASDKSFRFKSSEYEVNGDGSITVFKGKRLALYETQASSGEMYVTLGFKTMYINDDGLYFIDGGALNIPEGYTKFDENENCVISASLFTDYPDIFTKTDESLTVSSSNYTISQKMRQPQAAAVIMDNKSGQVRAMIGGRGGAGQKLFNRATNPRQPGSSIKPIAVYAPALQKSVEAAENGSDMELDNTGGNSFGKYITASSIINDSKTITGGQVWPRNSSGGYAGRMTLRKAVQQSCNVVAYKVYTQVGEEYSIKKLKDAGITTLDEEGDTNDINPAALALGGMTDGITPLEMTAAYATFPNGGVYKKPQFYTKVTDANGNVILECENEEEQIYDEGVAFIMTDILRSAVESGTGTSAKIGIQPVGGKTGTTSDQYDIWFAGFTPQYTMALWEGNDVNLQLTSMSSAAASFWASIMKRVCKDSAEFNKQPDNVVKVGSEYYVDGTQPYVAPVTTKATQPAATTTAPAQTDNDNEDEYDWEDFF